MFDIILSSIPLHLIHTMPSILFINLQRRPFSFTSVSYLLIQITLSPFLSSSLAAVALFPTITLHPMLICQDCSSVHFLLHFFLHLTPLRFSHTSIPTSLHPFASRIHQPFLPAYASPSPVSFTTSSILSPIVLCAESFF